MAKIIFGCGQDWSELLFKWTELVQLGMGLVRIPSGVVGMGLKKQSDTHLRYKQWPDAHTYQALIYLRELERARDRVGGGITTNNLPFSEISSLVHLGNILPQCTKEANESDHTLSIQL